MEGRDKMNNFLSSINKTGIILDKIARFISQTAVAVMVVTVIMQVFMRYFLRNPLIWADELSRYALVFMTFIGASVALRSNNLAAMELITSKITGITKKVLSLVSNLLAVLLLGFLFYYSISLMMENSVRTQLSPAMQVPMVIIYFSLPLGIGLTLVQAIFKFITDAAGVLSFEKGRDL
jgi:TRAP-type C4-dicarboxylate transport system permease small subunit